MKTGELSVLSEQIVIEGTGRLGLVTLNRPTDLNPLDWDTIRELAAVVEHLAADSAVRLIAITGAGRAFSAGGDLKRYQALQRDRIQFPLYLEDLSALIRLLGQVPKPCVALVNGLAVAGGLELILACDFAIGAKSARLGDCHQNYGQMGGAGVLTLLPRIVGPMRARELIITGRLLSADEALQWGLLSAVVEEADLREAAIALCRGLNAKSPLAVANAKKALNESLWDGTGWTEGLKSEREATAEYCLTSEDAPEGLQAFADKRAPRWQGR